MIASRVVEIPALNKEPVYTRGGVIEWLRSSPRRLADVVAALPDDEVTAGILDTACHRLRLREVRTAANPVAVPRTQQRLEREHAERRAVAQEMDRLRLENQRLRGELAALRENVHHSPPQGSPVLQGHARKTRAVGPGGIGFASPQPGSTPTGVPEAPAGFRVVTVAGRVFHVPEGWPRAKARAWCRSHPDNAVG